KLGILGSGKGSNFQAILAAIDRGELRAEIVSVLSDVADSGILRIAQTRGISAEFIAPGPYRFQMGAAAERIMAEKLKAAGAELVVLAGFMRILKDNFLNAFPRKIINIHPSLLPKFRGLEAWKQALEANESTAGCTVHYVDAGVDTGEILAQSEVLVMPNDTPETLHARIQEQEHLLLPHVITKHFIR
ncbi:MAG: phosphoribosylglycinamide formyltransferase, partial [Chthoniobacterales bacterium]